MIGVIVQQASHPSDFQEIADGVIILMIGGIGAYLARKLKIVDDIRDAFGTRKASEFETEPPLGFIDQMKANTKETRDNSLAVLSMSARFGEQNGTIVEIKDDVASLHVTVEKIQTAVSEMAGKPPASVAEVKEAVAQEHEASEARQAEILGAIKSDTTALVEDSHPDGGDSSRDVLDRIDVATQHDEPLES